MKKTGITRTIAVIAGLAGALSFTALAQVDIARASGKPSYNFSASSYSAPAHATGTPKTSKPKTTEAPANTVIQPAAARGDNDPVVETGPADLADPFEPINRVMFAINDGLDIIILRPAALIYKTVLPAVVRRSIGNFLANVATPITLANDLLQGEMDRAENTLVRFFVNSTVGVGGLLDVAEQVGYPAHFEDFGQTLAVYGAPSGPYLVLPVLGPATPRHIVGRVADTFVNPWTYILWNEDFLIQAIPPGVGFINTRADNLETLDAIRATTSDYYASFKSIYWQNRTSEIANGRVVIDDLPDIPN